MTSACGAQRQFASCHAKQVRHLSQERWANLQKSGRNNFTALMHEPQRESAVGGLVKCCCAQMSLHVAMHLARSRAFTMQWLTFVDSAICTKKAPLREENTL